MKLKQKAFTLIELLVVIAIIGLLASIVLVALNNARSKGRDAKRVSDLSHLQTALELYYNDNNTYPIGVYSTTGYQLSFSSMGLVPNYISSVPVDPINTSGSYGYYYASGYKVSGTCAFVSTGNNSNYIIGTRLENPNFPGATCYYGGWDNAGLNYLKGN